jgi:hypothetical protein
MKTVNQIRIEALRVIDKVIRLQYNVDNGCSADRAELDAQKNRLAGIKSWAIANDQISDIKHYFASHNFGQPFQFIASNVATYFNN